MKDKYHLISILTGIQETHNNVRQVPLDININRNPGNTQQMKDKYHLISILLGVHETHNK